MENGKLTEQTKKNDGASEAGSPDTKLKEVEFDDLLTNHIGEFGRYQWFVLFVLCYKWIITGFVAMNGATSEIITLKNVHWRK